MKILQLVGSPSADFYGKLSRLYAQDSIEALSGKYEFVIACVSPKGWQFPNSLTQNDIDRAEFLTLTEAIAQIERLKPDLALPQMFCIPGMTLYRGLLELLNIPFIGNRADLMALCADKVKTKTIVATAGVKVPLGEVLEKNERPKLNPPVVIKPVDADNSIGVSFVKQQSDYEEALALAFQHSERVLVEEFIPGREVRCGILDLKGKLIFLPLEEYPLNDRYPIRTVESKIKTTTDGALYLTAKEPTKAWIINPKDDEITNKVWQSAQKCHQTIGCRHYSLWDFRVTPEGEPYLLEAGLYCSFSPKSVIVTMAKSLGISLDELFKMMIDNL